MNQQHPLATNGSTINFPNGFFHLDAYLRANNAFGFQLNNRNPNPRPQVPVAQPPGIPILVRYQVVPSGDAPIGGPTGPPPRFRLPMYGAPQQQQHLVAPLPGMEPMSHGLGFHGGTAGDLPYGMIPQYGNDELLEPRPRSPELIDLTISPPPSPRTLQQQVLSLTEQLEEERKQAALRQGRLNWFTKQFMQAAKRDNEADPPATPEPVANDVPGAHSYAGSPAAEATDSSARTTPQPTTPRPLLKHRFNFSKPSDAAFRRHRSVVLDYCRDISRKPLAPPAEGSAEFIALRKDAAANKKSSVVYGDRLLVDKQDFLYNCAVTVIPQEVQMVPELKEIYISYQDFCDPDDTTTPEQMEADWLEMCTKKPAEYWAFKKSLAALLDEQAKQLALGYITIKWKEEEVENKKRTTTVAPRKKRTVVRKRKLAEVDNDRDMDEGRRPQGELQAKKSGAKDGQSGGAEDQIL